MPWHFAKKSTSRRRVPPAARTAALLFLLLGCRNEPDTPLAQAAASDDVLRVQALLASEPRPPGSSGLQYALHWAARRGASRSARALLDAGADIDGPDGRPDFGWTPLLTAVHTRQWDFARQLLAWGAGPDVPAPNGCTPLIMATGEAEDPPRIAFVEDLLLAGADPRAQTAAGSTALGHAVAGGNAHIAARLLAAAPDLHLGNGFTGTAVRVLATLRGDDQIFAAAQAEPAFREGWPTLLIAMRYAPPDEALAQLAVEPDPDVATPDGRTALMVACARGELVLVVALLDAGADPRAAEADHRTALSHAVASGRVEVVRALLDAAPGLRLQPILEDEGAVFAARLARDEALLTLLEERGALP